MTENLNIGDTSVPNAGRIYDFLLGGHHNFEIDRQTAENVLKMAPFMPQVLKLIRWFLGEATQRLVDQGFDKFIDFASGLPTVDHIHMMAGSRTNVIYSDIDPVTVEYGREILKAVDNAQFEICDAGEPEALLNSEAVQKLVGNDKKVVIGMNGIAYFLSDEQLQNALQTLYNWADEGSKLFLCDADAEASKVNHQLKIVFDIYAKIGQPIHIRSKEKLYKMAQPWKVDEPGFQSLDEWIGVGNNITHQQKEEWGGNGFYGVILYK